MAPVRLLRANELLEVVRSSIDSSGWSHYIHDAQKPFGFFLERSGRERVDIRVFIWNCTHGGGSARAADEFRIQFTNTVPRYYPEETTLLLGWHDGYGVFAAWNIGMHQGQDSGSPSAQIREEVLRAAYNDGFAVGERGNGEIVAAFKPELFAEYAANAESIHNGRIQDLDILNDLSNIDFGQTFRQGSRRMVSSTIIRAYREVSFSKRVLAAYSSRCAVCGIQLRLIEAAHIVPVAVPESTDLTCNGIALCALHHKAYDSNLLSVAEDYSVQLSMENLDGLRSANLSGGIDNFVNNLQQHISLPADRRDFPSRENLVLSRRVRGWR
ncbi:HNH endonuclease [Xanthomonas campestris]|uniref:HNH endonuclease n=1 Tax=Xanthomonas campestris TaxID=339 RepID=UPI001E62FD06|nr:HNH endonuclease [Xanthomonas campestris]MCC5049461.1 HNH endonuclease [Xanthomonas campestris]MCC5057746.1 HNH endonuclease [Xanthomonas campestris]MCC5061828.1 HNH endonuclease [Xanthomonas campestris]